VSDEEDDEFVSELPVDLLLKRLERLQRDKAKPIKTIIRIFFMNKPRAAVLGKQGASILKVAYKSIL